MDNITQNIVAHLQQVKNVHHVLNYQPLFLSDNEINQYRCDDSCIHVWSVSLTRYQHKFSAIHGEDGFNASVSIDFLHSYDRDFEKTYHKIEALKKSVIWSFTDHFTYEDDKISTTDGDYFGLALRQSSLISIVGKYQAFP